MPRQPMAFTVPQPLEPLNIEEVRFWLDIMQEHAVFIKAGLPCDRTDLINEAQSFMREFETLGNRADKVQNDKKFNELVAAAYDEVRDFHRYKRHLLRLKLTCKLGGFNFPLQLDHMAREAEYVMRLFDKMRDGRPALKAAGKTQENAFWVRIMGDHAKLMSHLIDPSERSLVNTARDFAEDFDALYLQSQDFASMLHYNDSEVPSFRRFIQDVRVSTRELRDFKRASQEMIAQCKMIGLIPELLADHVRREADHFLMILTMIEKGIISNTCVADIEEYEDVIDVEDEDDDGCDLVERDDSCIPCDCNTKVIECDCDDDDCLDEDDDSEEDDADCLDEDDEEYDDFKQTKFDNHKTPIAAQEQLDFDDEDDDEDYCPPPPPPKVEPKKEGSAKYKWGGKWPRPLGKA